MAEEIVKQVAVTSEVSEEIQGVTSEVSSQVATKEGINKNHLSSVIGKEADLKKMEDIVGVIAIEMMEKDALISKETIKKMMTTDCSPNN